MAHLEDRWEMQTLDTDRKKFIRMREWPEYVTHLLIRIGIRLGKF